ncbi:helix-turn-helix protein [Microbacterium sp. AG790]|uniref:helix-turn-helix domain-containing protein n=1 Tax=Microbacterium sp. AG790 TaxID=2183995 RepID=UPI000EB3A2B4|nr:helix-turn-helix domain-containing protein [Microbacterium sp. AG790]RKS89586.1 helix-turn-helix protein [Microbacterium sp. AG790]
MIDHDRVEMAGARLAVRVAELIRLTMARSELTQRQLAERLGVGEARVSQILRGDGNFHLATVARVFAALGYDTELKVYDGEDREVKIVPRRARRKPRSAHFSLAFETTDGGVRNVESYVRKRPTGRPVDFPLEKPLERELASRQISFTLEESLRA